MRVDWAIFAEKMDSNPDGTVNVYSMGTPTVAFRSLPNKIPTLTFFVMLMFADADRGASYPMQATLVGPDAKAILSEERRVQREKGLGKLLPFTFKNIPVVRAGTYRARFEAGGQRREWPFLVAVHVAEPSSQSSPPASDRTQPERDR